ncbi:MAG: polysaccharide biosynthesis C-terminal domain-containing protein, partial [Candidatus Wildermuthbacteria bacterium]|nr:polysaccharide biosynthesis C-terminal domain-containing protein [Candidatus Wildermuthbacteria bacterium]
YLIGIPWPFVILAVLAIPSAVFSHFLGGIFLGKKRFDIFSALRVAADTLFLLLVFLFVVFLKRGVQGVALANAIAAFLIAGATCIAVARLNASMFWNVHMAYVKQLFSYGFQSYAAGLLGFINYKIDLLLVNAFLGTLAVGYYALAVNIGEGLWLITSAAALILFARISSDRDIESINAFTPVVVRNVLFLTICAGIFLLIAGEWIVPLLYSKDFLPSLIPLYLLLPGIFAMSVSSILANDYAGRGRPSINIYLAGCGLAIKVASTMILIPAFGIYGAAIATSFSYSIFAFISILVYRSISKNSLRSVLVLQRSDLVLYKHFIRALLHSARRRLS